MQKLRGGRQDSPAKTREEATEPSEERNRKGGVLEGLQLVFIPHTILSYKLTTAHIINSPTISGSSATRKITCPLLRVGKQLVDPVAVLNNETALFVKFTYCLFKPTQ